MSDLEFSSGDEYVSARINNYDADTYNDDNTYDDEVDITGAGEALLEQYDYIFAQITGGTNDVSLPNRPKHGYTNLGDIISNINTGKTSIVDKVPVQNLLRTEDESEEEDDTKIPKLKAKVKKSEDKKHKIKNEIGGSSDESEQEEIIIPQLKTKSKR